jgi:hypothetical protein
MVAVRDNQDRDLLGDNRGVICERPRAESRSPAEPAFGVVEEETLTAGMA